MAAPSLILADISWPYLVFAALLLVLLLSWPPYRRLLRKANVTAAEGDSAASLEAALELHTSRLPTALLSRWRYAGLAELWVAERYYLLGSAEDTLTWCRRGLATARQSRCRALLHNLAAQAHAEQGEIEAMDQHLESLREILRKNPLPEVDATSAAIWCNYQAGRLDRVEGIMNQELPALQEGPSPQLLHRILWTLVALGRFDEVLALSIRMLASPVDAAGRRPFSPGEAGMGLDRLRDSTLRAVHLSGIFAAASAAAAMRRWDLCEQYLAMATPARQASPHLRVCFLGHQARLLAAANDHNGAATSAAALRELLSRYPRDTRLRVLGLGLLVKAWQELGLHERVLAELQPLASTHMSPIDRSELTAAMAVSLEAMGRYDEAQAKRIEARALAPLACWNQPVQTDVSPAFLPQVPGAPSWANQVMQDYVPQLPADRAVRPVASNLACAAWVLAPLALVPLAGVLFAIPLLVLAIILRARRQPLPHDRRVGAAGLAISLAAVALLAVWLADIALARMGWPDTTDLPAITGAPATWPGTQSAPYLGDIEDPSPTASAPFDVAPSDEDESEWSDEWADIEEVPDRLDAEFEELRASETRPIPHSHKALFLGVLVISIMFHEIAHALAALWAGDPTARDQRRFSLNPIRHIDLLGSIIVPIALTLMPGGIVIGWAKPVPIQPGRFRHPRRGLLGVTLAGVSVNLLLALAAADILCASLIVMRWIAPDVEAGGFLHPMAPIVVAGVPGATAWAAAMGICKATIWINAILAGFNLLPLPPLDGFGVLRAIAPGPLAAFLGKLSGLGMIVLLCLIAFDALTMLLMPAIFLAVGLIAAAVGLAGWL